MKSGFRQALVKALNYYPRWMVQCLCHILTTQPREPSAHLVHKSLGNPFNCSRD